LGLVRQERVAQAILTRQRGIRDARIATLNTERQALEATKARLMRELRLERELHVTDPTAYAGLEERVQEIFDELEAINDELVTLYHQTY
jgi:hypothetical protein